MTNYIIKYFSGILNDTLIQIGLTEILVKEIVRGLFIVFVLAISWIVYKLSQGPLIKYLVRFTSMTNMQWDNILVEKRVFQRLLNFLPLIFIYILIPPILEGTLLFYIFKLLINGLFIIFGMILVQAFLNAIVDIYSKTRISNEISITPFVQIIKLALYLITIILLLSLIMQKTPLYFLSGLGALTAVLLFIFKDILMGFIAGIQLIANKMVAPKDWIEMPKYGADGDVIEITLTTVKVKNFDNTITTIPTYALINESFKNWRNMNISGGRRIKRYVNIDISSIKFCDSEMLEKFSKIELISKDIEKRQNEIKLYNKEHILDENELVNGRRLTNIGIFRSYLESYLKKHPQIHNNMTFLVRQLSPKENGLPIEIYVFCRETKWSEYEKVQADIFDHILAVVPEFKLRVFQEPSGTDFKNYSK